MAMRCIFMLWYALLSYIVLYFVYYLLALYFVAPTFHVKLIPVWNSIELFPGALHSFDCIPPLTWSTLQLCADAFLGLTTLPHPNGQHVRGIFDFDSFLLYLSWCCLLATYDKLSWLLEAEATALCWLLIQHTFVFVGESVSFVACSPLTFGAAGDCKRSYLLILGLVPAH